MARRTKADALETRNQILDAAEAVFQSRGVSRATLGQIATAAGVTRGAIYWHFADKAEIFDAMMQRVLLPLEGVFASEAVAAAGKDPIGTMRARLVQSLRQVVENEQMRRVFEIAMHKVEFVDELTAVRDRRLEGQHLHTARIRAALQQAIDAGRPLRDLDVDEAAFGLHAMIDGLFQAWMMEPDKIDLPASGARLYDTFIRGAFEEPAAQRQG